MSALVKLFVIGLVAVSLTACGKSEDTPEKPAASTASSKTATSAAKPVSKPATATKPDSKAVTTYRSIKARLRENGEPIDILVPDDVDIESGRMLEYKVGDDGKYYLKSVIPQ